MATNKNLNIIRSAKKKIPTRPKNTKPYNRYKGVVHYHPDMCDLVIECMSEYGMSKYEVSRELGISISTLRRWGLEHEEFGEALRVGVDAARAWWEELARQNMNQDADKGKFNTSLWIFIASNRFGYSSSTKVESRFNQDTIAPDQKKKSDINSDIDVQKTAEVISILSNAGYLKEEDKKEDND